MHKVYPIEWAAEDKRELDQTASLYRKRPRGHVKLQPSYETTHCEGETTVKVSTYIFFSPLNASYSSFIEPNIHLQKRS